MSDIQKLREVIGTLEEQSASVEQFNGLLKEVGAAKAEIVSSKEILKNLGKEQNELVSESRLQFSEYGEKLKSLERSVEAIDSKQKDTLIAIQKLSFLTPEQFNEGLDKILLRVSELKILSPNDYKEGRQATEANLRRLISARSEGLEKRLSKIQKMQRQFLIFVVSGFIVLGILWFLQ